MSSDARIASSLSQNETPTPTPFERSIRSVKPLKPSAPSYLDTTVSRTWLTTSSALLDSKSTRPIRACIAPPSLDALKLLGDGEVRNPSLGCPQARGAHPRDTDARGRRGVL